MSANLKPQRTTAASRGLLAIARQLYCYYLRQVNKVNDGDNVFVRRVSVCVSVCAQRTGKSDLFKTVIATVFKFDTHVPNDSPDMSP